MVEPWYGDGTGLTMARMDEVRDTSGTSQWVTLQSSDINTPQVSGSMKIVRDSKGIHPRLYFKYIKYKMSVLQFRFFKQRMQKLEKLVDEYAQQGQEALSEACVKQYLIIARESAIWACGIKKFVTEEHINKFRYSLKGTSLKITPLKNFVRVIPKPIAKKLKECATKKLFDEYLVVHLDNKSVADTEKEKKVKKEAREKDPILFGRIQYSDKYYFIGDWEDEYDDLRLTDMIKKLSLKKEDIIIKNSPTLKK